MYITINNVIGEKTIDLSYPIHSFIERKEIAVISVFSDNMHKLSRITEMIINSNELDNSDNREDGRPSNALPTYHVTADEGFTRFEPNIPQYKKLKNEEFVSLTLKITDQNGSVITDGPQVTVVLHIRDCKS